MSSTADLYQVGASEKIKSLESELLKELQDLKNDVEENEMLTGVPRAASSVGIPKGVEHFRKLREQIIRRSMQVSEAQPLVVQAEVMKEEMNNCLLREYTEESLPLLLHQFFCDRVQQLVQCKHMHMLRWRRFCEHTKVLETLYPVYQKRLMAIMAEYTDAVSRAQRLSVVHESLLIGRPPAHTVIEKEDLVIYLRWLITHLHSVKKIHTLMKHLEWISVSDTFSLCPSSSTTDNTTSTSHQTGGTPSMPFQKRPSIFSSSSFLEKSHGRSTFGGRDRSSGLVGGFQSDLSSSSGSVSMTVLPVAGPVPNTPQAVAAAAAAGGGPSSDPIHSRMPVHLLDFESLKPLLRFLLPMYGLTMDLDKIRSTSEEMELAAHVSRKFKATFFKQEEQRTFPTYDKLESGNESWGADSSSHALLKESNWLPYIKIKPEKDAALEKMMTKLRQANNIDELLRAQSRFFSVKESAKVMDALRDHAVAVRDPPEAYAVSVTSNRTAFNSNIIWKKIYSNPSLFKSNEENVTVADFDEREADNVSFGGPRSSQNGSALSGSKKRTGGESGYDYVSAMQMLGLEEEDSHQQDPTMVQGGLLSFLQLRHLRIRDLQRTCLSVLNYFRSLERTLTINDGGLSLEGKNHKNGSTNHIYGGFESGLGGGGSLGYHGYLHNTPADFKQSESEFMEFSDIGNHDDFYSLDEGRVHVQDLRGYYVIYDEAEKDFKKLSTDLMLVATHYIEKDVSTRKTACRTRGQTTGRSGDPGGIDLASYGHLAVDRFAVLLDLWTNEAAFLQNKRQLIDVYVEAYHHVFDMHERRLLAQVIVNLMYQRPRYDFSGNYFIGAYRSECRCLRLHCKLVKSIMDRQIDDQREYIHKLGHSKEQFGLPYPMIAKQPVALNISRPALKHVYMLEFHPSLSLASRIPVALKHALNELTTIHRPESTSATIGMEEKLLELSVQKWLTMDQPGSSYSNQLQKDLFSDLFVGNPHFVCDIGESLEAARESAAARRTPKEKLNDTLRIWSKCMEMVTTRHRLIEAATESEILAKIYRKQATAMGFDEFHLFLMCVQFDFANFKENADNPPPLFITALQEDDPNVDRYVFANLQLGVQELDEKMAAALDFRSREGVLKILTGHGLEKLQVVLMTQVLQKNASLSAVQQVHVCSTSPGSELEVNSHNKTDHTAPESHDERSSHSVGGGGNADNAKGLGPDRRGNALARKFTPESFISLQLEKKPSRDIMLNNYLNKKSTMGSILKNPEEADKLKRTLVVEFCQHFNARISQYSYRGQIIAYLNSILVLLESFPSIRKNHFMIGEPNEKKTKDDSLAGLTANPRELKKRPRRLLSQDGSKLLNLWFIPHRTEVLIMYKTLENETCVRALHHTLKIVSSLHDILRYLCAHSKLGSAPGQVYLKRREYITADWGGSEGILAELRETQRQIDNLDDPTDPEQVGDLLALRRDVLFLEFDAAVRHSLRRTLLTTKNADAFRRVTDNMNVGLPAMSNVQRPSVYGAYMRIPEPLQPRDFEAQATFPWRAFLGRRGPYPLRFWQWNSIENYMQLCLCELKDVDRHAAHGEILGVSLLMEEVLQSGQQEIMMSSENSDDESTGFHQRSNGSARPWSSASTKKRSSRGMVQMERDRKGSKQAVPMKVKPLSRTTEPVKAYILLKDFLLLWKRLELFKEEWGQRKLAVQAVDSPALYHKFCQAYKIDILYPVIKNIASKYGQEDLYEGMTLDDEPVVAPRGASEMEMKAKQLVKLLDELENHMIGEVQRKVAREHALVFTERAREEGNLPTDLWKRGVINERPVIPRPHIAEDFTRTLLGCCESSGDMLTLTRDDLDRALSELAIMVMTREKSNYENYSMFYENLLQQHHQLLYQKEQEIKHLGRLYDDARSGSVVDVQCQLADRSHELILEITALRSKIGEMEERALSQQEDVRNQVRSEFDQLLQNLFNSTFNLKNRFDQFGQGLYDECYGIVSEVRAEAAEAMSKYKSRSVGSGSDEAIDMNLKRAQNLQEMRHENIRMAQQISKMKSFANWKITKMREGYNKEVSHLQMVIDRCRKDYLYIKMMAEEEVVLLRQQVVALRGALAESEQERESTAKLLDKESRIKTERKHREDQEAYNARQMELARAANLQRMVEDINEKELLLQEMTEDLKQTVYRQSITKKKGHQDVTQVEDINEKEVLLQEMTEDLKQTVYLHRTTKEKSRKDVTQVKHRLHHERHLKLDAFQRVDELQTQVYDYEAAVSSMSRPYTSMSVSTSGKLPPMRSRASTSLERSMRSKSSAYRDTPPTPWPPGTSFPPQQRSLTPDPRMAHQNGEDTADRMTQRPKTVGGRLRNKIAEQLLNNLKPVDHARIMQIHSPERGSSKAK